MVGEVGQQHPPAVEAPVPPVDLLALCLRHLEAEVLEVVVREQLVTAPAPGGVLVQTSITQSIYNFYWLKITF